MAIKRYVANADTTITNAFKADLTTRGTGSNMGASDSLEVFSIYGQIVSGSNATKTAELSRILINFPVSTIVVDRNKGDIPLSGSVDFYLRMFNAEHPFTVPDNFTLSASAVTRQWEEGYGLDMENYSDLTHDITGSSWMNATSNFVAATLADAIDLSTIAAGDAFTMTVPAAAGGDGTAHQFKFDTGTNVDALSDTTGFGISTTSITDDGDCADQVVNAINGVANNKYQYGGAALGAGSALTAGTLGITAAIGTSATKVTLTMDDTGAAGNVANVLAANDGFAEGTLLLTTTFTGGDGPWDRPGGDYDTFPSCSFVQTFDTGTEDLEMDITPLVEQWINSAGNVFGDKSSERYGLGVHLTSSQEAKYTGKEENGNLNNLTGSTRSYYTKKFFARGSEFFFKRPTIEARWDSSTKDDRGNFYLSSSLAPAADNLMKLYLYNFVRGQLKNIPALGGPRSATANTAGDVRNTKLLVTIFSGSSNNTAPSGEKLALSIGGGTLAAGNTSTIASWFATGSYSASFAFTGSSTLTKIWDVWYTSSVDADFPSTQNQFFTGTVSLKNFRAQNHNPNSTYVVSMPNLRQKYSNSETARFRLSARKKDWNPTIYTKATNTVEASTIENAYYKIYRVKDDYTVIDYGTGSLNHTRLSYDISGSFFDLNTFLLQGGYMYGIKYVFYENGKYTEQSDEFKFRVE